MSAKHTAITRSIPQLFTLLVLGGMGLLLAQDPSPAEISRTADGGETFDENTAPASLEMPILVYHHVRDFLPSESEQSREYVVTPTMFERQMQYLHDNGYTSVLIKDVTLLLEGTRPVPEKPVIITFDDGRLSQYNNALPVLTKYDMHATFFIFTNAIDANDKYLTSSHIRELDALGHEIASHTILHPYLTRASHELLVKELVESKAKLERIVAHDVVSLAYPFGLSDEAVLDETKQAGYLYGRTLSHTYEVTLGGVLELPGYIVTNDFDYFLTIMEGKAK